jgi:hypothetical protein
LRFAIAAESCRRRRHRSPCKDRSDAVDQSDDPVSLSAKDKLDLLHRFAPRLHFDALERWRPSLADEFMRRSTFLDGDDRALPGTPPAEAAMLAHLEQLESKLNPLRDGPGPDTQARGNALLTVYGLDLADAGKCYGRVFHGASGSVYLQYWLFYVDNPCVLPPGRHDGDWELVQVCLREAGRDVEATHVTLAGHGKPVTRPFSSRQGGPDVYVAVDSHASYHEAGAHPMLPLSDVCTPAVDDLGLTPEVTLLEVEEGERAWANWQGRWGIDQGTGTRIALRLRLRRTPAFLRRLKTGAGESPPSPARQGASWSSPWVFQTRGTQRKWTNVAVQRLAHLIGEATWPEEDPQVTVTRAAPGRYAVEARAMGRGLRRVTMVSVSFEEVGPDDQCRGLAMYSVPADGRAHELEVRVEREEALRWRAAGYNRLRQRGEPIGPYQATQ